MRRAIQKHLRDFLAIIAIAVVAVLVGGYILSNQRFYAPSWVPLVGSDFVDYQAEMATAQAFTAGQGQTVMIAGVSVGEIGEVTLKDGRANITMKLKRKYTPIYKDATVALAPEDRPERHDDRARPGQQDGRRAAAAAAPSRSRRRCRTSTPTSSSPGSTSRRATTSSCCSAAPARASTGNAANLSATLKRFDPLARNVAKLTR